MPQDDHLAFSTVRISPGKSWTSSPEGWRFVLVRQGRGEWVSAVTNGKIEHGDVLMFCSATEDTVRARPPKSLVLNHFRFAPDDLVGLLTVSERQALDGMSKQGNAGRLFPSDSAFARQFQDLAQRPLVPGALAHRSLVLQVVGLLLNSAPPARNGARTGAAAPERVREVVEQLTQSQLQSLSVEELARKCGCGRRHLNRLLRQEFGCSFLSLKMELRLDKAAALLRGTDDKVINVAMECGFNHLGLFSARFRRRFGVSPSEWRRRALASDEKAGQKVEPRRPSHPTIRLDWSEPAIPVRGAAVARPG